MSLFSPTISVPAFTDRSGITTTANVSHQIMAPNANRKGWVLNNPNADKSIWVSDSGPAIIGSCYRLGPYAHYEAPINGVTQSAIFIICDSANVKYVAREW